MPEWAGFRCSCLSTQSDGTEGERDGETGRSRKKFTACGLHDLIGEVSP